MGKKSIIVIIIIFCLIIVAGWFYFSNYQISLSTSGSPEEVVSESEEEVFPIHTLSDRAKVASISGGGDIFPTVFKELIIDPAYEVQEGEEQYFSIWAKDPDGVEKVTITIKTDKEDATIKSVFDLQLVEGTSQEGRWEGSWITENIPSSEVDYYYLTDYQLINTNGQEGMFISSWYSGN
jgi:uncharacterized protein YpmB